MEKAFKISKAFPNIEVVVTRDSVCAADDCDAPHTQTVRMPSFVDPIEFVREIKNRYPLPMISGGRATWTCHLNKTKIAVIAQEWTSPKAKVHELSFLEQNEVHFKYHAQDAPENY